MGLLHVNEHPEMVDAYGLFVASALFMPVTSFALGTRLDTHVSAHG